MPRASNQPAQVSHGQRPLGIVPSAAPRGGAGPGRPERATRGLRFLHVRRAPRLAHRFSPARNSASGGAAIHRVVAHGEVHAFALEVHQFARGFPTRTSMPGARSRKRARRGMSQSEANDTVVVTVTAMARLRVFPQLPRWLRAPGRARRRRCGSRPGACIREREGLVAAFEELDAAPLLEGLHRRLTADCVRKSSAAARVKPPAGARPLRSPRGGPAAATAGCHLAFLLRMVNMLRFRLSPCGASGGHLQRPCIDQGGFPF